LNADPTVFGENASFLEEVYFRVGTMVVFLFIVLSITLSFILIGLFVPSHRRLLLSIGFGVIGYIVGFFVWILILYFRYLSIDRVARIFSIEKPEGIWWTLWFCLPPLIPVILILVPLGFRRKPTNIPS